MIQTGLLPDTFFLTTRLGDSCSFYLFDPSDFMLHDTISMSLVLLLGADCNYLPLGVNYGFYLIFCFYDLAACSSRQSHHLFCMSLQLRLILKS